MITSRHPLRARNGGKFSAFAGKFLFYLRCSAALDPERERRGCPSGERMRSGRSSSWRWRSTQSKAPADGRRWPSPSAAGRLLQANRKCRTPSSDALGTAAMIRFRTHPRRRGLSTRLAGSWPIVGSLRIFGRPSSRTSAASSRAGPRLAYDGAIAWRGSRSCDIACG